MVLESSDAIPLLVLATALHVVLAILRDSRKPGPHPLDSMAFASAGFGVSPWLFPTPTALGLGLVGHILWCVVYPRRGPGAVAKSKTIDAIAPGSSTPAPTLRPVPVKVPPPVARASKDFVPVPVLSAIDETPDIRTFRLARPGWFDFKAGQYLTVRLPVRGKIQVRSFSICSAPEAKGYLEISVKRRGIVSSALHANMRSGSLLSVQAPAGEFTYPAEDERPILLIGGGIGITPLLSMVRHAVLCEPGRPVTLLYSARRRADLAFRDELEGLLRRSPRLRVVFALTGETAPLGTYPGRIDETLIRTVPAIRYVLAYVCGPRGMIDSLRKLLERCEVPSDQIRSELFDRVVTPPVRARLIDTGTGPSSSIIEH